jgi:hypothetical protein
VAKAAKRIVSHVFVIATLVGCWFAYQLHLSDALDPATEASIRSKQTDHRVKYAEYEKGKRSYSDAYVLIDRIRFDYPVVYGSPNLARRGEGKVWDKRKQKLIDAHPDLKELRPTKLSEEIANEQVRNTMAENLAKKAATWTPPDVVRGRVFRSGNYAVAFYQFKIEFYNNPRVRNYKDLSTNYIHNISEMQKIDFPPTKTMTFKHRFRFLPNGPDPKNQFFLCTELLPDVYGGMTDEERDIISAKGYQRGAPDYGNMPWVNQSGEFDQFCGIVSMSGEIVYKFPLAQHIPDLLANPLGFSDDEKSGGIIIGEKVRADSEEPSNIVGNPREIWIWHAPDRLDKVSTKSVGTDNMKELRRHFHQGKL